MPLDFHALMRRAKGQPEPVAGQEPNPRPAPDEPPPLELPFDWQLESNETVAIWHEGRQ